MENDKESAGMGGEIGGSPAGGLPAAAGGNPEPMALAPSPAPAPAALVPGAGGEIEGVKKIGNRSVAAIYLHGKDGKPGEVASLSEKEAIVLRYFLKTKNYAETAKEAKITEESAKRMLRRPSLKAYLLGMIRKSAIREAVDEDWSIMELVDVWEGKVVKTSQQMEAMKQIGKILSPKGPGVVVNTQQNSYYAGMPKEATDAEWTDARATAAD